MHFISFEPQPITVSSHNIIMFFAPNFPQTFSSVCGNMWKVVSFIGWNSTEKFTAVSMNLLARSLWLNIRFFMCETLSAIVSLQFPLWSRQIEAPSFAWQHGVKSYLHCICPWNHPLLPCQALHLHHLSLFTSHTLFLTLPHTLSDHHQPSLINTLKTLSSQVLT